MTRSHLLGCALAVLVLAGPARAENWPGWRGPTHNGLSTEKNVPSKWGVKENLLWTLKLPGRSSSTPAIWGDRSVVTGQKGSDLLLMCLSTDGKERWTKKVSGGGQRARKGEVDAEGNSASPSPSPDGKHVYSFFETGV